MIQVDIAHTCVYVYIVISFRFFIAFIESVMVIADDPDMSGRDMSKPSLVIKTSTRELKLKAADDARHSMWFEVTYSSRAMKVWWLRHIQRDCYCTCRLLDIYSCGRLLHHRLTFLCRPNRTINDEMKF